MSTILLNWTQLTFRSTSCDLWGRRAIKIKSLLEWNTETSETWAHHTFRNVCCPLNEPLINWTFRADFLWLITLIRKRLKFFQPSLDIHDFLYLTFKPSVFERGVKKRGGDTTPFISLIECRPDIPPQAVSQSFTLWFMWPNDTHNGTATHRWSQRPSQC